MSTELEEAIKRLRDYARDDGSFLISTSAAKSAAIDVLAELERTLAVNLNLTMVLTSAGEAKAAQAAKAKELAERITELEAEKVDGVLPNLLIDLQGRITELEALTDPCPDGLIEVDGVNHRLIACSTCGGLGRVAKAQPETEHIEIRSPDFFYIASTESGGGLHEANRDERVQEVVTLTMVKGSGSWETQDSE